MVTAINSLNLNSIGYQELEVMRRLQSLGLNPSGNLSADRQLLQKAEIQKRQDTLSAGREQNLNKLQGSGFEFSDALKAMKTTAIPSTNNIEGMKNIESGFGFQLNNTQSYQPSQSTNNLEQARVGATQIAELNKYRFGLA